MRRPDPVGNLGRAHVIQWGKWEDKAVAEPSYSLRRDLRSASDAELVSLAAAGDPLAFRTIMERNNTRLYRVARSVLRSDSEAEDAVQEAYMRAFRALSTFRSEARLSTWLTRIVLNEAMGRVRRSRPTAELSAIDSEAGRSSAELIMFPTRGEPDPERSTAHREMARILERAIDRLPDIFRVVFVLRAVEEMSVEETAEHLGLPEATVKTRLHRARRLLRQEIEAEIGSAFSEAYSFAGVRCARMTETVLARLGFGAMPEGPARRTED